MAEGETFKGYLEKLDQIMTYLIELCHDNFSGSVICDSCDISHYVSPFFFGIRNGIYDLSHIVEDISTRYEKGQINDDPYTVLAQSFEQYSPHESKLVSEEGTKSSIEKLSAIKQVFADYIKKKSIPDEKELSDLLLF